MGRYLSAKDFYKLKSIISMPGNSLKDLYKKYEDLIWEKFNMRVSYSNYIFYKLAYTLLLYNFLKLNKEHTKLLKVLKSSNFDVLKSSLKKNNISLINPSNFKNFLQDIGSTNSEEMKVNLFAPICPDYATTLDSNGQERYTFNGIGNGVGLVGRKFLYNIPKIIEAFKNINIEIEPIILLDENNESKFKRLNLTNEEFMLAINGNKKVFEKIY